MRLAPAPTFAVARLTVRAPRLMRSCTGPGVDEVRRSTASVETRTPARRGGARSSPGAGVGAVAAVAPLPTMTLPCIEGCASHTYEYTPGAVSCLVKVPPADLKPESNCAGPWVTWTLCVPSPQFQVTDSPGATVTSEGPKALLAMVTLAAFAVAGRRLRAPAARAAAATWRKNMVGKATSPQVATAIGESSYDPCQPSRRSTRTARS